MREGARSVHSRQAGQAILRILAVFARAAGSAGLADSARLAGQP
jgi:hypothetical protein